jgi:hypothetical protein
VPKARARPQRPPHFHSCRFCSRSFNCFCQTEGEESAIPNLCPQGCRPTLFAFDQCTHFGCSSFFPKLDADSVGDTFTTCDRCDGYDPEAPISPQELKQLESRPYKAFSIPFVANIGLTYFEACYTKTTHAIEYVTTHRETAKPLQEAWYKDH